MYIKVRSRIYAIGIDTNIGHTYTYAVCNVLVLSGKEIGGVDTDKQWWSQQRTLVSKQ